MQMTKWCLLVMAGALLVVTPACSKKTVQSGGDTQSSQKGAAASGGGTTADTGGGVSSAFPDTTLSNRESGSSGSGLRGLDSVAGGKTPSEERVSSGSLVAKADTASGGNQADVRRAEEAAAEAAGLRDVFFAYDSFAITEEGRQALARDAEWLKTNPSAQLKIEGHCDERGTSAYNLVLGEKRAKSTRNFLVELGVSASRLSTVSFGKERPFCLEHNEECYKQNRRGHLLLKVAK